MAWTLCSSGAAIAFAGANVNSTAIASNALLAHYSDAEEGDIIEKSRRDWVSNYSSIASGAKLALANCCARKIANDIINYDMSGFTSRTEAQTMLDVNSDAAEKILSDLKDFKSNDIKAV